jgi:hypothetical protein
MFAPMMRPLKCRWRDLVLMTRHYSGARRLAQRHKD